MRTNTSNPPGHIIQLYLGQLEGKAPSTRSALYHQLADLAAAVRPSYAPRKPYLVPEVPSHQREGSLELD
jgi:hypothetical protein